MTSLHPDFTHLHVHSHFTLLGGTASIDDLVARAVSHGFKRLALTDTNALYGAVAFTKACRRAGIQPLIGMTISIAGEGSAGTSPAGSLVLLAYGPEGYRSLCRLSSKLQSLPDREDQLRKGFSWEDLEDHSEGLICLTGGRRGWADRLLRSGDRKMAYRHCGRLAELFRENFYLSLEIHGREDREIIAGLVGIGEGLGVSPVAVQPVYVLDPEDKAKLRLLAAIDHNCELDQVPQTALPAGGDAQINLHWLAPGEVLSRFRDYPEALDNVARLVARFGPAMPEGAPIWPALDLPDGQTSDEALRQRAFQGLSERFGPEPPPQVRQRLERELRAITGHGYAPLFLIVADIVRFAHQAKVPVSTRGSVANSLVAYCAGITTVDPIEHDLLFERFLNPARKDLPDIDLDFCSRRRDEILAYVREKYGEDKVALVATISTLRPRSALRETAKAYGLEEQAIHRLAGAVPRRHRRPALLEEVLEKVTGGRSREIVRQAFSILGQPHHLSLHPGGVVITPGALTDVVPVQWSPKGFLITQYDHQDVEAIGLPKLDLLGIRALTVLADAADLVREHHDPDFQIEGIRYGDVAASDLLARGETIGVFQCESSGSRRTLRQLRARSIRDLAIANAFFRPGPIMGGMAESFVRRFRGQEEVSYLHPSLEPILGPTRGVIIFQEQILRIGREIAGLSWAQADRLRRGISKLRGEEMAKVENQFLQGCQVPSPWGHGLTEAEAQRLWEQVSAFSGFGFNQGHATAYADVSYRSAYMKAHWPAAFLCARLADRGGYHHPAVYMAEAVRLGIRLRPPHIHHSKAKFTLTWQGETGLSAACLWMGLDQVRDLRQSTLQRVIEERVLDPFRGVRDFAARVGPQAKELEHLIKCGGLDGMGKSRAEMLAEAQQIIRAGGGRQMAFDFATPPVSHESPAQAMSWEMHILGYPMSVHPLSLVEELPDHVSLRDLAHREGEQVSTVGVRLPGWTGGKGFFFGDGDTYIVVQLERGGGRPAEWKPHVLQGSWRGDGEGTFWFQADRASPLRASDASRG
jgi:DNA-directed DNA polymerase III PolC